MIRKLLAFALMLLFGSLTANAQQNGWMSRYWDGCKPSCSWSGKPGPGGQCKECDRNNQLFSSPSDTRQSACQGGTAYTCWDMIPFVDANDPNKAYAFAATPSDQCGACYELSFNGGFQHGNPGQTHQALNGKTLIVMASNMGGDVQSGQFDVLIPGGGLGNFDAFSSQIGVSAQDLGATHGGLLAACGNPTNLATAQSCLKGKCAQVFGRAGLEWLKAGCDFYADWFMAANNPTMTYRSVSCPQQLTNRYKNSAGSPPGGSSSSGTPTTYTLTVNRNPTAGGTTSPTASQSNIAAGTPFNISASASSGYTFQSWTAMSGSPTIGNDHSANTTVTLYANATIRANFTLIQSTTYTLTVNRNPTAGGTTNPAASQSNIAAGTPVNISASASNGYTFQNWELTSGQATFGNANSAATTVTLISNATIRANFTQNSSGSSSSTSSSSIASGIGNCIPPPGLVSPPNGIETCIVVEGKCYMCNQARGQDCLQEWIWQDGSQASTNDYWYTEVSCPTTSSSSGGSPSSSSGGGTPILPQTAYSNGAHIQANGIYLQVMKNARLELFDLRGNSVKKMNFSNGIYSVQLNDLPRGLYLARVSFGNERKILRVPLR